MSSNTSRALREAMSNGDIEEVRRLNRARGHLRWIAQKHANGCLPACVAMVLAEPYEDICAALTAVPQSGHDGDWEAHGLDYVPADRLLGEYGYFLRRVFVAWELEVWPPAPFAPVHIAQVVQASGHQHSVVMDSAGCVLDPLREGWFHLTDWPKVNNVAGYIRRGAVVEGDVLP